MHIKMFEIYQRILCESPEIPREFPPTLSPTQRLKSRFSKFRLLISQIIWAPFCMIFKALSNKLFRKAFHKLGLKSPKFPEFSLAICNRIQKGAEFALLTFTSPICTLTEILHVLSKKSNIYFSRLFIKKAKTLYIGPEYSQIDYLRTTFMFAQKIFQSCMCRSVLISSWKKTALKPHDSWAMILKGLSEKLKVSQVVQKRFETFKNCSMISISSA